MDYTRKVWPGCAAMSACAIVAALSPRLARATEVATRLDYSAAPGCPGAEDFAAAVAGRLGYRPFRKDASERVVVRIEPAGKGLAGRLEWRDAAGGWIGEQTLPSRTGNCLELVHAMGFALAVQFQLMGTLGGGPSVEPSPGSPRAQPPARTPSALGPPAPSTTPPSASGSTSAGPPTSVTPPPAPTLQPTAATLQPTVATLQPTVATLQPTAATLQPTAATLPPPGERVPATVTREAAATSSSDTSSGPSLTLGAGAAVAFDAAPSVVPLGRLFGAVGWTHVVVELAGEISSPSSSTRRQDGAGFTHREVLGSLAGCGLVRSWGACLVAKVGEIRVTGQGVDVPATATGFMMQMGARLTWTHMLGTRFEIAAHADGLALATEGRVTLDSMPAWTTPRFTASLGVDVGVRFQ